MFLTTNLQPQKTPIVAGWLVSQLQWMVTDATPSVWRAMSIITPN